MESQDIKQRIKDDEPTTTTTKYYTTTRTRRQKKMAMAKRGLRSLSIAVAIPVSLTLLTIYLFGSSLTYSDSVKPFWYPPLWAIHLACLGSSFLMGLSAWLVWAEGGFHGQSTALPLYMTALALSLAWGPIVFTFEGAMMGLMICVAHIGALVLCSRSFRKVNPIAGDLVKLCLAWVAFLTLVTFYLL